MNPSGARFTQEYRGQIAERQKPERCLCGREPVIEPEDYGYVAECLACQIGGWGATEAEAIFRYHLRLARRVGQDRRTWKEQG